MKQNILRLSDKIVLNHAEVVQGKLKKKVAKTNKKTNKQKKKQREKGLKPPKRDYFGSLKR